MRTHASDLAARGVLLAALTLGLSGCISIHWHGDGDPSSGGSGPATALTADTSPFSFGPPGSGLLPGPDYVQTMALEYSSGGVMVTVDVTSHDFPALEQTGTIRVWAGAGGLPGTLPPAGEPARVRSPDDFDVSDPRWAGSTIVRRGLANAVWVYIEAEFDESGTSGTQIKPYTKTWSLTPLDTSWRAADDYP